jgi:hypothetical protein
VALAGVLAEGAPVGLVLGGLGAAAALTAVLLARSARGPAVQPL